MPLFCGSPGSSAILSALLTEPGSSSRRVEAAFWRLKGLRADPQRGLRKTPESTPLMQTRLDTRHRFSAAVPAAPVEIDGVVLLRPLGPGRSSERWLARRQSDLRAVVAHLCPADSDPDRWLDAAHVIGADDLPHALSPIECGRALSGRPWAVTRYTGDHEGLVSLESLIRRTGGRASSQQTRYAVFQLLRLLSASQQCGRRHGFFHLDEVLVDRRGSLNVELCGLRYRLSSPAVQTLWSAREEIRSVAMLAAQLLTGATEEMIDLIGEGGPERFDADIGACWMKWLERAITGVGFERPEDAASELARLLEESPRPMLRVTTVRNVVDRFLSTR